MDGLSWMDLHGWTLTSMDDFHGQLSWMIFMDDCHVFIDFHNLGTYLWTDLLMEIGTC